MSHLATSNLYLKIARDIFKVKNRIQDLKEEGYVHGSPYINAGTGWRTKSYDDYAGDPERYERRLNFVATLNRKLTKLEKQKRAMQRGKKGGLFHKSKTGKRVYKRK